MVIDYSVVIRTTGKAGLKYQKLLDSIQQLDPRPREVIVVLPEGFPLPPEQLGWETFCYSPKGMVVQRMAGLAACKTPYALFCDDDVCFGPDFVAQLYAPVRDGLGSFSIGPLYSFLPVPGIPAVIDAITARAIPTVLHKSRRYVSVLKSTGYSYNRHLQTGRYYETQSAAWTCFFADTAAMNALDFHNESWLDAHGYSAMDDQTMFYKAWLRGHPTIVSPEARYEHLDARTSIRNNNPNVHYSSTYNRLVFWHRFIYSQGSKTAAIVCYSYRLLWELIFDLSNLARRRMTTDDLRIRWRGWRDALRYIHSQAYRSLPDVK